MDEVNFFTQLLWGTGALFGHLLILGFFMWASFKFGRTGKLFAILGGTVMMVAVLNNMAGDNIAFIMVIPYFIMVIMSAFDFAG